MTRTRSVPFLLFRDGFLCCVPLAMKGLSLFIVLHCWRFTGFSVHSLFGLDDFGTFKVTKGQPVNGKKRNFTK